MSNCWLLPQNAELKQKLCQPWPLGERGRGLSKRRRVVVSWRSSETLQLQLRQQIPLCPQSLPQPRKRLFSLLWRFSFICTREYERGACGRGAGRGSAGGERGELYAQNRGEKEEASPGALWFLRVSRWVNLCPPSLSHIQSCWLTFHSLNQQGVQLLTGSIQSGDSFVPTGFLKKKRQYFFTFE